MFDCNCDCNNNIGASNICSTCDNMYLRVEWQDNVTDVPTKDTFLSKVNKEESERKAEDAKLQEQIDAQLTGNVVINDTENNKIISNTPTTYNIVTGTKNTVGQKGYKILNITMSEDKLSLDIELDDNTLEEKAANSYAISDPVVISCANHAANSYAISDIKQNESSNTVLTVKSWSVIDNKFNEEPVKNLKVKTPDADFENWLYVIGKSYGTPVLRSEGVTATGMENSGNGRYSFVGGRNCKTVDDGGVAFGRENTVGYLCFAQGRQNNILQGYAFGNTNTIENNDGAGSFVKGTLNKIYHGATGSNIFGHANVCKGGTQNTLLGTGNTVTETENPADAEANLLSGHANFTKPGSKYSASLGERNDSRGKANLLAGSWNTASGTNNFVLGHYNVTEANAEDTALIGYSLSGKYPNQVIIGNFNKDDENAIFVVANKDGNNRRNNVTTINKDGDITTTGDVISKSTNLTDLSNDLNKQNIEIVKHLGSTAKYTSLSFTNSTLAYDAETNTVKVVGGSSSKIAYVPVSAGDVLYINALTAYYGKFSAYTTYGWYFTDSKDVSTTDSVNVISMNDTNLGGPGWGNLKGKRAIVAPEGASYFLFSYNITKDVEIFIANKSDIESSISENEKLIIQEISDRKTADEEIKQQIADITAIQIRNKSEVIESTESNVQTVATKYIKDNYSREPQNLDGLIITVTDKDNDKILYVYSEVSNIWINSGINDVDLSNYYTKEEIDTKVDTLNSAITDEIEVRTQKDTELQNSIDEINGKQIIFNIWSNELSYDEYTVYAKKNESEWFPGNW